MRTVTRIQATTDKTTTTMTTTLPTARLLPCQPLWLSTESFGLVLLLISAFLYSIMGVFLKLATAQAHLPSTQLVWMRATFQGSLVVLAMTQVRDDNDDDNNDNNGRCLLWRPFGATWEIQRIVILRGAIGGTGFLLYYYTLAALPLGDAIALLSLKSVVTIFLGRLILGEAVRLAHVLVACASLTGAVLIAQPTFLFGPANTQHEHDENADNINPTGYVTALVGACTAASVLILIRKAGSIGAHTLQLLFAWAAFGWLLSLLAGWLLGLDDEPWQWPQSPRAWSYIAAMCIVGSAGHFLLNFAGKLAPAGPAAVVRSADLAMAYAWQVSIFDQTPTVLTISGVVLIAMAILTLAVDKVRHERAMATNIVVAAVDDDTAKDVEMSRPVVPTTTTTGTTAITKGDYSRITAQQEDVTEADSLSSYGGDDQESDFS